MEIFKTIIEALYFFLPAYVANTMPIFAAKIFPKWSKPISEKQFGTHKTWRGFIAGIIGTCVTLILEKVFLGGVNPVLLDYRGKFGNHLIDYAQLDLAHVFILGTLFAVGALGGDLMKSYAKRKIGRAEGRPWVPFDQLDFVIGGLAAVYFIVQPPLSIIITLLVITPLLHLGANTVAFGLGLKKVWW